MLDPRSTQVESIGGAPSLVRPELPSALEALVAGALWAPGSILDSGAEVFTLSWAPTELADESDLLGGRHQTNVASSPSLSLQVANERHQVGAVAALVDKHDRWLWMSERVAAPNIQGWFLDESGGRAILATEAPAGLPATADENRSDVEALILALALGLRSVHDLAVEDCPFAVTNAGLIAHAATRVQGGFVDRGDLSAAYRRYEATELLDILRASDPGEPTGDNVVVVHGNLRLANLYLANGEVVGYAHLSGAGVGDRYRDLALLARDIATMISPEALGPFFDAYGIAAPDLRRIDFHVLLDEFF